VRAGNSEMNRGDTKRTGLGWTGDKHLQVQPDVGLTDRIQEVDERSGGHGDKYGGGAQEELTPLAAVHHSKISRDKFGFVMCIDNSSSDFR